MSRKRRIWEFTDEADYQRAFYKGNVPGFENAVSHWRWLRTMGARRSGRRMNK